MNDVIATAGAYLVGFLTVPALLYLVLLAYLKGR